MFNLDAMDAMVEAMTQPTPAINQSTQNSTQAESGIKQIKPYCTKCLMFKIRP